MRVRIEHVNPNSTEQTVHLRFEGDASCPEYLDKRRALIGGLTAEGQHTFRLSTNETAVDTAVPATPYALTDLVQVDPGQVVYSDPFSWKDIFEMPTGIPVSLTYATAHPLGGLPRTGQALDEVWAEQPVGVFPYIQRAVVS